MKTVFIRKAVDLADLATRLEKTQAKPKEFVVEKTIELSENEWRELAEDFFGYKDYIAENLDKMICIGGIYHCLLVKTKGEEIGLLIQSEGYPYARYTSMVNLKELQNG